MKLDIGRLADRPGLPTDFDGEHEVWPPFMQQDPVGGLYFHDNLSAYPEYALFAVDPDEPDRLVARALSVPFSWAGDPDRDLPVDGWDGAIRLAALDRLAGVRGNLISALEIAIRPDLRGKGLAGTMLAAMRANAIALGFTSLVAPVRPTDKHRHPRMPIGEYAARTRDDGLPEDPWLRVHLRAGGRIVDVCHRAMCIPGTLAEWRRWTGLPFDTPGDVEIPGALVPVHCDPAHDYAVYIEPAVWIHHRLT